MSPAADWLLDNLYLVVSEPLLNGGQAHQVRLSSASQGSAWGVHEYAPRLNEVYSFNTMEPHMS